MSNNKELDKQIKSALEQNVVLPDVVEQKVNAAYEYIKNNEGGIKMKKRHSYRFKFVTSLAACIALLCVLGAANPAFASKIPFVGNIFEFFQSNPIEKDPLAGGNQQEIATDVNKTATDKDISITVQQASLDGTTMFVTFALETNNKDYNDIDYFNFLPNENIFKVRDLDVTFDGKCADEISIYSGISMSYVKEGVYVGMVEYDLTSYLADGGTILEAIKMEYHIKRVVGVNEDIKSEKKNIFTGVTSIEGKETKIRGDWRLKFDVKVDTSKNKVYETVQEENGIKLNKVTITPGTTLVEIEIPNKYNDPAVVMQDSTGKELGMNSGYVKETETGELCYDTFGPTAKDAKYILVKVIDKNVDNGVLAEFKVELDN